MNRNVLQRAFDKELLKTAIGEEPYIDLLEALSNIQSDKATILVVVSRMHKEYLETDECVMLTQMIDAVSFYRIFCNGYNWIILI